MNPSALIFADQTQYIMLQFLNANVLQHLQFISKALANFVLLIELF